MVLALLAAPAAGQTPLVDVPASADGPVHFSAAPVARSADLGDNTLSLFFTTSATPPPASVPSVSGRGFGLLAVGFTVAGGVNPNRWVVGGAPSISTGDRNALAVVVVGPGGTTPRVLRLSEAGMPFSLGSNTFYYGPVVSWAAQARSDVAAHQAPGWTILVVDHTDPDVNLDTLTYGTAPAPPAPPPPPAPARVTGVRVSPRDGALRVSWSAAAGEVSQYRVHAEDGDGRFRRVYTDADVFEALVDGLANGVDYTVTVAALTSHPDVEGAASEPRTVTPASGGGDTGGTPDPVPALPLAGAGVLAGLLAAAARRWRGARRRARRAAASR